MLDFDATSQSLGKRLALRETMTMAFGVSVASVFALISFNAMGVFQLPDSALAISTVPTALLGCAYVIFLRRRRTREANEE